MLFAVSVALSIRIPKNGDCLIHFNKLSITRLPSINNNSLRVLLFNPLSANFTKWSNSNLPTNCLSVFDHFVGLVVRGLKFATSSNPKGLTSSSNEFSLLWASSSLQSQYKAEIKFQSLHILAVLDQRTTDAGIYFSLAFFLKLFN